jgi:hypothetical protein
VQNFATPLAPSPIFVDFFTTTTFTYKQFHVKTSAAQELPDGRALAEL